MELLWCDCEDQTLGGAAAASYTMMHFWVASLPPPEAVEGAFHLQAQLDLNHTPSKYDHICMHMIVGRLEMPLSSLADMHIVGFSKFDIKKNLI